MSAQPSIDDIEAYLEQHQQKELLRLVTVGSVDDGKSTMIGRLLHETKGLYEDQLADVRRASSQKDMGIDYALVTDGLKAEREQGITIDVAYRYFSTERRKFIIADTPGHVQYTRNMATGASTANVAVILIDARLGVLQQSRRHAYIASLLGIPHLAVAVNKMDLRNYDQGVYEEIREEFLAFASKLSFRDVTFIPVSALKGDNIVERTTSLAWYDGPTLLEYLETVPIAADRNLKDFRFPVQYVIRPDLNYRGVAGEISSGVIQQGDSVMVLPSRKLSRVVAIDTFQGSLASAQCPEAIVLRLADEIDVSRGDMLVQPDNLPAIDRRFEATVVWMSERALDPHKSYLLKHTTQMVRVEVESVMSATDLNSLNEEPTKTLELNDIGRLRLVCHRPLFFDPYRTNRRTGAFVLIDSLTNNTVAAGMIQTRVAAERETLPRGPHSQVSLSERFDKLGSQGAVVLIQGGTATSRAQLAFAVERRLFDLGKVAAVVDTNNNASKAAFEQVLEMAGCTGKSGVITIVPAPVGASAPQRLLVRDDVPVFEVGVGSPAGTSSAGDQPGSTARLMVDLDRTDLEAAASQVANLLEAHGVFAPPQG